MTEEAMQFQDGVTERVADFVSKTRFQDVPEEVVYEHKRDLLDSIGICFAGSLVDKGRFGIKLARRLGGPPEATIIGTAGKVSSSGAAFANGELMNALDFDSVTSGGHLSPYMIPGPLALAECVKASGKDLIVAIAVGSEISYRLTKALTALRELVEEEGERKYVWPDVSGWSHFTLGGALAVGKVLGLDKEKLRHALGIAAYLAPLPTQQRWRKAVPMSMTKYAPAGWISQATVTSALLAQMNYAGDITVLDGKDGFWRFYGSNKWQPEELINGLGKAWRLRYINYKLRPCGYCQHPADEIFAEIMEENNLSPDDIQSVKILEDSLPMSPSMAIREMRTHIDAQFCVPYVFSLIAHKIPIAYWQNPNTMRDPNILKFMDKIATVVNPDYGKALAKAWQEHNIPEVGAAYPEAVEVVANGKVFRKERMFPKGRALPEYLKLTDAQLVDKFKGNASWSLSEGRADELADAILSLEQVEDVSEIMRLTSV